MAELVTEAKGSMRQRRSLYNSVRRNLPASFLAQSPRFEKQSSIYLGRMSKVSSSKVRRGKYEGYRRPDLEALLA
jgi:hypothetical protein